MANVVWDKWKPKDTGKTTGLKVTELNINDLAVEMRGTADPVGQLNTPMLHVPTMTGIISIPLGDYIVWDKQTGVVTHWTAAEFEAQWDKVVT